MTLRVHLLDLDPGLAEGVPDRAREDVARRLVVRVERVEAGEWRPAADAFGARGGLGLLIVDGVAVREVALGARRAAELLGPGDVLRPWEGDGEHSAYPFASAFRVIAPLDLAVLDRPALLTLTAFPDVLSALLGRAMERSRRLAGSLAIAQLSAVDTRLHVALWHLADRFGHVAPEGVIVPVRLTHDTLGTIVGARRPSVTAALGRLTARGLVEPRTGGGWLLHGEPPQELTRVRGQ